MQFSDNSGQWQRRMAESQDGRARRMAVFEALSVRTGQCIVDIGCGGGHLVRDLGLAVGSAGRVVGLDASTAQIDAGRALCHDLPQVTLTHGDATHMDLPDADFDALAAIQSLEYIPDVDAALEESRRVLKTGATAAFVSVMWDHWRFHGPDPELNDRMLDVWRAHCTHQMLPLEMPGRLARAGFAGVIRRPMAFFNGSLHENAFATWAARLVRAFAVGQGVAQADADRWFDQLAQADREGRFGFVSVPVLTTAIAR